MDNNELLQAIGQIVGTKIDEKLQPINDRLDKIDARLDKIEEDIEIIREDTAITRVATNSLLEWAEDASIQVIPLFNKRKA